MILEGILTTVCPDGRVNIAPMGPLIEEDTLQKMVLRPYRTSTSYQNLKRTRQGVFHITDDVWLLAQAALGTPDPMPVLTPAKVVDGFILADTCRWYALRINSVNDQQERTEMMADVVGSGCLRDFLGFNRAKHAVLEAAILATRIGLLPAEQIAEEFKRLGVIVDKTGGQQEHKAFALLSDYLKSKLG